MTKFNDKEIMVIRYLRGHGYKQSEIAQYLGVSRQVISYQLNKMRSASIDKGTLPGLKQAGGISPLVGYVSAPCPPSSECCWCHGDPTWENDAGEHFPEPSHSCPVYVEFCAYAQMEDLPKHQKITVLLSLLQEVEAE